MKLQSTLLIILIIGSLLIVGCIQKQDSGLNEQQKNEIKQEVQKSWDQFTELWLKGDPAATSGWYTENCLNMPDDIPTMEGNVAVKNAFTMMFQAIENKKITYKTLEVDACEDKIFELGLLEHTYIPKGAAEMTVYARYFCVWHRQDDNSLKIHRYLFNTLPQTEDAMKIFKARMNQ